MIGIAEFAVRSRICCGHVRQFALRSVIRTTSRYTSTLVTHASDKPAAHSGTQLPAPWNRVICASDPVAEKHVSESFHVYEDFISEDEERSLVTEVEPYLKRLKYEHDHWDDAINGYRETEKRDWSPENRAALQRMRALAFAPDDVQLEYVHVLDVMPDGVIRPHIDSVRFCGSTIAALSLLSSGVLRLTHHKDKTHFADVLLARRSMYIMQSAARYDYTHELLPNDQSLFKGQKVERTRRISVICRSEPSTE